MVLGLIASIALAVNLNPDVFGQLIVERTGTVHAADGKASSAKLDIGCGPSFLVDLTVPVASGLFDFDDFQGLNSTARNRTLSRLKWIDTGQETSVSSATFGWNGSSLFTFRVQQEPGQSGPLTTLMTAIGARGGKLEWMQTAFDDPQHTLTAEFAFDAAAAASVQNLVASCLPPRKIH